ncbi:MAG: hypothetical protein Kow0025_10040 [Thermodesulfovibrionales bacterium]
MKDLNAMSADELRAELRRLREALVDLEETHAFDSMHTRAHIGAEEFKAADERFREESAHYVEEISRIEEALRLRGEKA